MKLIQTKDYLLLIDEEVEININDYITDKYNVWKWKDDSSLLGRKKVLAYRPLTEEAKELDLPLLPNPFEEDNIEKLADNYAVDTQKVHPADSFIAKQSYIEGYKAAQSKQFSLEDVKKAIKMAREDDKTDSGFYVNTEEEIIQSLSTQQIPSEFIPVYEVKYDHNINIPFGDYKRDLKTITDIGGKEVLVGSYKY